MALVSYDYGSESDNDDEPDESSTSSAVIISPSNENQKIPKLLSQLPQTQSSKTMDIHEEKLEDFIPKYKPQSKEKKREKVRITIPALSEFQDVDDEPEPKKKRPINFKGSTLLSMLPPAKGAPLTARSFIPNILKNKPPSEKKPNSLVPHAVRKKAEETKQATIKKLTKITGTESDDDDDDDIEIPETFDEEIWHKVCGPKSKIKQPQVAQEEPPSIPEINIAPEPVRPYDGLDNAAFKELVGKAKRPVNIKLIDINEEEIVPDKERWMTKAITDPEQEAPVDPEEDPLDPTRKKKHHITYLAHQAKSNEQELAGQWSANKFARNQTRAKYGF